MAHNEEELKKHVRVYISVFVALMFLTVLTVTLSYLHLSVLGEIIVALVIATIKASLVALYFMHLISEQRIIVSVLALTAFFFLFLLAIPVFGV